MSYLYDAGDEIHINDIYWRPDDSPRQYWSIQSLPGRRYPKKPVYVLTSHETFSGGEELAYDLQTEKGRRSSARSPAAAPTRAAHRRSASTSRGSCRRSAR